MYALSNDASGMTASLGIYGEPAECDVDKAFGLIAFGLCQEGRQTATFNLDVQGPNGQVYVSG